MKRNLREAYREFVQTLVSACLLCCTLMLFGGHTTFHYKMANLHTGGIRNRKSWERGDGGRNIVKKIVKKADVIYGRPLIVYSMIWQFVVCVCVSSIKIKIWKDVQTYKATNY